MKHWECTASGRVRNGFAKGLLDRLLAEAPPGELARRSGPGPPRRDHEPRALSLRREGRDRLRGDLVGNPVALEAPADRLVPVPPLGERLRAAQRVTLVVDEPDALQAAEGLLAQARRKTPLLEPQVELRGRLLPARDRSERGLDGASAAQLAGELTRAGPVELLPYAEPDADEDLRGHGSPARSVELDGDLAASKLAEPGDDRHYAGSLTFAGSLTCSDSTASALVFASAGAASDSVIGSSRAETI